MKTLHKHVRHYCTMPAVVLILRQAIILIQLTQTTTMSHCLMLLSNFNMVSEQKVGMGN